MISTKENRIKIIGVKLFDVKLPHIHDNITYVRPNANSFRFFTITLFEIIVH